MMSSAKVSKYKNALLDTSLLLPYLIGHIMDTEKFKHTKNFTQEDGELLNNLIMGYSGLCSTPHVITEVSNLAGKLRDNQIGIFRHLLSNYIKTVEEFSISSKELIRSPFYFKLGITDTALLTICQQKKIVLITSDFLLANYAHKIGLEFINFNHLRQQNWGIN